MGGVGGRGRRVGRRGGGGGRGVGHSGSGGVGCSGGDRAGGGTQARQGIVRGNAGRAGVHFFQLLFKLVHHKRIRMDAQRVAVQGEPDHEHAKQAQQKTE